MCAGLNPEAFMLSDLLCVPVKHIHVPIGRRCISCFCSVKRNNSQSCSQHANKLGSCHLHMASEWHDPCTSVLIFMLFNFFFRKTHSAPQNESYLSYLISNAANTAPFFFTREQRASSRPSAAVRVAPTDASQLPQWLFGFAGLIPDGFGSRVIRLSPKGQRACQVSPHINVVLLTPWADSTARRRGREKHWSGVVGGTGGWRGTRIVRILNEV